MIPIPGLRLWRRWRRGSSWAWTDPTARDALPERFHEGAMTWPAFDRFHAKQGRSTARVRLDGPRGTVWGYLKRHELMPRKVRLLAWLGPDGRHSPAAAEHDRIARAGALGIRVPRTLAAGERLAPGASGLHSYLLVEELRGLEALNEAMPRLAAAPGFESARRRLARELAAASATLHNASLFHKDLYLCHFFVDPERPGEEVPFLIDWQRLGRHPWTSPRWRWKDLGQLLYSTFEVPEVTDRDRLRFWAHYRKLARLGKRHRLHLRATRLKAERYRKHNG